MNDAFGVGGAEAIEQLGGEAEQFWFGNGAGADFVDEAGATDELHDDETGAGVGVEVVHGGDVRMIEFGERAGFAAEAREEFPVAGEFGGENF